MVIIHIWIQNTKYSLTPHVPLEVQTIGLGPGQDFRAPKISLVYNKEIKHMVQELNFVGVFIRPEIVTDI